MHADFPEAHAALARLARNNVVGLRDLADARVNLKEAALRRFIKICQPRGSHMQIRHFLETKMIGVLQAARLTINFDANKLFYNGNAPEQMLNLFDRSKRPTHKGKDINELRLRNSVEMTFGGYGGRPAGREHSPHERDARRLVAHYGATGIDRAGLPTSPSFHSMMRPRYGALDFAYCQEGGASFHYGKSFLVLKEHVKHASTYSHTDSFKVELDLIRRKDEYGGRAVSPQHALATYFELEKILLYCTPHMLMQIYLYASGQRQRGTVGRLPADKAVAADPKKGTQIGYIEFQAHTDIRFDRDVDEMYISRREVHETLLGLFPWHAMQNHIRAFARERSIRLTFL